MCNYLHKFSNTPPPTPERSLDVGTLHSVDCPDCPIKLRKHPKPLFETLPPDNCASTKEPRPTLERIDSRTMTVSADTPVNGSKNTRARRSSNTLGRSPNESPEKSPGASSSSPSPAEARGGPAAFDALKRRFAKASNVEILVHCMGGPRLSGIPEIAKELAEQIIVICVDLEHWSENTDEPTEVGITTFARRDLRPLIARGDFGDHGEHLLQQAKFYLFRLIENSHLRCMNKNSRGVNGNRFGQARFVTIPETRKIMEDLFVQPIKDVPGMQGNRPIIVLGQDVGHDKENLKKKSTSLDVESFGTLLREIDTQVIVRDREYWTAPKHEQIGLANLVKELWFEHSDPHTAANDAARTLICAFQMALGGHTCKLDAKKTMLEVATGIEKYSVENFTSIGGVKEYCWKCGTSGHMMAACTATGLKCDECGTVKPEDEHVTLHCFNRAQEKALDRRQQDYLKRVAKRNQDRVAKAGRPATRGDFHPSTSNRAISAVANRVQSGRESTHNNGRTRYPPQGQAHVPPRRRGSTYRTETPLNSNLQQQFGAPPNHNRHPHSGRPGNSNTVIGRGGHSSRRGHGGRGRGGSSQTPRGGGFQTTRGGSSQTLRGGGFQTPRGGGFQTTRDSQIPRLRRSQSPRGENDETPVRSRGHIPRERSQGHIPSLLDRDVHRSRVTVSGVERSRRW